MEATEGTNGEGHRSLAGVAYCRRAGNNDARVYARLARRVYPRTALQENDLAQIYLFGHRKKGNNGDTVVYRR